MSVHFPIRIFRVEDRSMEPGIRSGDYLIVSRIHSRLCVGDVVVLKHPKKGISMVKRISTLGGARFFVTGDNKKESEDSRTFGSVGMDSIMGKVVFHV